MQNQSDAERIYKSLLQSLFKILRDEGLPGWARGLTASICRELSYSSIRIGAYEPIRIIFYDVTGTVSSPAVKFLSALCSGFIGAYIATPFDLIKTRFQAELPGHQSSTTTYKALHDVFQLEGMKGLYKGWQITTLRAAILTSAQLGSYDSIKNNLLIDYFKLQNGLFLHLCASLLAGVITTTAVNPSKFCFFPFNCYF
jgi:hypothetical protein